jgi:hypothetical protein
VINFAWGYVAALFVAAVWLARRYGAAIPWRVAALFYVLVLAVLFRPLTQQVVNFPADVVRLMQPWRAERPIERGAVSNFELQDVTMQIVPWAHQVRSAWRSLRAPLWNEMAGCGYPLLGNGQSAALSPIRLAALPVPMPYAIAAEAAMKLLVALVGMFLLCRRRYGELAGVAGAVAYGLATYLITWLHFPIASVAAFLPLALLGADLVTERADRRRIAIAGFLWAAMIVGGHPETTMDGALLVAGFILWIAVAERRFRSLSAVLAAGLLALLIASPFIAPVAETMLHSERLAEVRARPPAGVPYSDAPSLALLVQPRFYGALVQLKAWGPASAESISGFAGILGFAGFAAAIASAIRRKSWRERELFFAMAALMTLGVLADWAPLTRPLRAVMSLSNHSRFRVVLCLCAAMLTAALVERLRERRRESLIGIAFAVVALAFPFWIWRSVFTDFDSIRASVVSIVPSVLVLALAGAGLRIALPLAIAAELFIAMAGWNAVAPAGEVYPRTPLIARMQELLGDQPYRFAGVIEPMYPNTNAMFGLPDVRVHDPMASERYTSWLAGVTKYDRAPYYAKLPVPASRLLGMLNVRYVAVDPGGSVPDADRYRLVYSGADGTIMENLDVRPRFFSSDADVQILSFSATDYRLRVVAPRPALVLSSVTAYPGWRVTGADGPLTIDGVFLGFRAGAGTTEVRVHYFPLSFYIPAALSLLAIVTAAFMIRARV